VDNESCPKRKGWNTHQENKGDHRVQRIIDSLEVVSQFGRRQKGDEVQRSAHAEFEIAFHEQAEGPFLGQGEQALLVEVNAYRATGLGLLEEQAQLRDEETTQWFEQDEGEKDEEGSGVHDESQVFVVQLFELGREWRSRAEGQDHFIELLSREQVHVGEEDGSLVELSSIGGEGDLHEGCEDDELNGSYQSPQLLH